ncbi:hypothetical protein Hanom_Chr17g01585281 [Helianthus anomalus]
MMTRATKMTRVLMTTSYDVDGGDVWISDSHTLRVNPSTPYFSSFNLSRFQFRPICVVSGVIEERRWWPMMAVSDVGDTTRQWWWLC